MNSHEDIVEFAEADLVSDDTQHSLFEDGYALIVGTILLSMGVILLQTAQLATGGVAGLALTLSYLTGVPVGLLYAVLSLPMLALTVRTMGRVFLVKTVIVTLGLFAMTALAPYVLVLDYVARPVQVLWSLLGVMATGSILFLWHRPGRYNGY